MNIKFSKLSYIFIFISLLVVINIIFFKSIYYVDKTEKIYISNNSLYIVRHRVPIDALKKHRDMLRLMFIDSLFFLHIDPFLEKFDLNNGNLIEKKKNNMIFHTGYFVDGFIRSDDTDSNVIKIYDLDSMNMSHFNIQNIDNFLYDNYSKLFFAQQNGKLLKLKNENDFEDIGVNFERDRSICCVDKGLFLICIDKYKEKNLKEFQIFNLSKKTIKEIDLDTEDFVIYEIKDLMLLARRIGSDQYFFFELIEKENVFQIKNVRNIHMSIGICDEFSWDRKNNKIYFFNTGDALFQDNFDIYQYDDNTLEKKIIHVKLKR